MKTIFIGYGYKAQVGKSTSCKAIKEAHPELDIRIYSPADCLKTEMYDALLSPRDAYWDRRNFLLLPHPEKIFATKEEKIAWVDENKPRLADEMQYYGTSYRRVKDPFYWLKRMDQEIKDDNPQVALIESVRFKNEYYYVTAKGGYTVKLTRSGFVSADRDPKHPSETELDGIKFHFEVEALDGDVDEVKRCALVVFDTICEHVNPAIDDTSEISAVIEDGVLLNPVSKEIIEVAA